MRSKVIWWSVEILHWYEMNERKKWRPKPQTSWRPLKWPGDQVLLIWKNSVALWSLALYRFSFFFSLSVAPHSRGQHLALSEAGMPFWHCTLTWRDVQMVTQNQLSACRAWSVILKAKSAFWQHTICIKCDPSFSVFFGNNQYPVLPLRAHTLLVFFNKMRSHWARMSIHLASLCLTNSGAGPTLLKRDRVDNNQLIEWLLCAECLHLFVLSLQKGSALKIKKGNRKTTRQQFYVPMATG